VAQPGPSFFSQVILFLHNRYRAPGGEERVVEDLMWLVREGMGEPVELLAREGQSTGGRTRAAAGLLRGGLDPREVADAVHAGGARVVHAHNINPTFGWRALAAARGAGARVVVHLHQYRLVCAVGVCFTQGEECVRCHGRNTLPGVLRGCRGGVGEALVYGAGLALWQRRVVEQADAVIVPSEFARERLRELGAPLPWERVHVLAPPLRALAEAGAAPAREASAPELPVPGPPMPAPPVPTLPVPGPPMPAPPVPTLPVPGPPMPAPPVPTLPVPGPPMPAPPVPAPPMPEPFVPGPPAPSRPPAPPGEADLPPEGYALVVARLAPEKGIDVAIEACRRVGIPLVVAGEDLEGNARGGETEGGAEGAAVRFVGRVDDARLARLRAGAALALVPSRSAETFGLAAAEAMAAGLPVVASRVGALPELVGEECLAPPGDAVGLAAAIERLRGDPRAGARALERVRALCAPEVVAGKLARVYEAATAS
jgi:glycosyltransferase involved in cell wall biosynthesis